MRTLTEYVWQTGKLDRPLTLIVVSDLHDASYQDILPMLDGADALISAGDTADRYRQSYGNGVAFLTEAARRLPTYVGVGNHDRRLRHYGDFADAVRMAGAHLLDNRYERLGDLVLGCWYHPEHYGMDDMLPLMETEAGFRLLLCHKPEDYMRHLQGADVDLVLSGHAHGGQIRVFGQGLYAPGQGIFPKYTRGLVGGRMIVSAGASNAVPVPRWGNPCEVLRLRLS